MVKFNQGDRVIKERVSQLRNLMKENNVNAYIIPSNDEYMNEYVPSYARRLEYITGFTGSNGLAIITEKEAFFFTDGRYLNQSEKEINKEIFKIFNINIIEEKSKISSLIEGILGYDPKLFTSRKLSAFSFLKSKAILPNLIDLIWKDQPERPSSEVYDYELEFSGKSHIEKIALCRDVLSRNDADHLIINDPDSICWLLNLRASDTGFSPIMLGFVLLSKTEIYLFTDESRINKNLRPDIKIHPEEKLEQILRDIKGKILLDKSLVSDFILNILKEQEIQDITNPCMIFKACKNEVEIKWARESHIKDAVAIIEFLANLSELVKSKEIEKLSEYELGIILNGYRQKQDLYVMDSFSTICGFQDNSAVIHYRAKENSAKKIIGNGILLIDSGAQYKGCTTDVTRTLSIGIATPEQKKRYSQVLKGHIALALLKFPVNTSGANIDIIARQFLWQDYVDYAHGTGHGVGSFLSVHEGPQSINQRNLFPLMKGMIVSNEPGYYKNGEFGIRIENLVYVKETTNLGYLEFENLTLVPYAQDLIEKERLTSTEINYIKKYNQKIMDLVHPKLSINAQKWLENYL